MTEGIQLDFTRAEVKVVEPKLAGWLRMRQLLETVKTDGAVWDEMDVLAESLFPPKTKMGRDELRTYLDYEALRERTMNG